MKSATDKSTVIVLAGSQKNAALYFDYLIPITMHLCKDEKGLNKDLRSQILPPYLWDGRPNRDVNDDYLNVLKKFLLAVVSQKAHGNESNEFEVAIKQFWQETDKFLRKYNLKNAPLLLDPSDTSSSNQNGESSLLSLSGLQLIDIDKTTWEQIIEFRKNKDSAIKLRKLKNFFQEQYVGQEIEKIKDDLYQRIYEYENATKDFGFETKTSTLAHILSSKVLASSTGASLFSALIGSQNIAAITALAGVCIELGKVSLHLSKRQYELFKFKRDHPLAYIIDAKENLTMQEKA